MRYFDHDTDAAKDELIQALRLECGGAAVDVYWTILEQIYLNETDLVLSANRPETKSVLHWLCTDWNTFAMVIKATQQIGLFVVTENGEGEYTVHSERAQRNIDAYHQKQETARQNGRKGGRKPKANQRETESVFLANQTLTQPLTKEKEKEKETSKEDVPKGTSKKPARFTRPGVDDVRSYADEIGQPGFDATRFIDYYDSNGWKVGRNAMKDWRAAVRSWVRREGGKDDGYAKYR